MQGLIFRLRVKTFGNEFGNYAKKSGVNLSDKAKTQKEKDNLEKEFISWVLSQEPIKLDVPSMFEKDYANMNRFMEGESTYLSMENFDELKLPYAKKNKTGYSTDADVLKKLMPYLQCRLWHF